MLFDLSVEFKSRKKNIEENQKRMKDQKQWKSLCIDNQMTHSFRSEVNKIKDFLETCQNNSVKCTAEMSGLNVYFQLWNEQSLDKSKCTYFCGFFGGIGRN